MRLPEDVETIWQHHGKLAAIRYLHSEYQLGWHYATLCITRQSPHLVHLEPLLVANRWHYLSLTGMFAVGIALGYWLDHAF